MRSALSFEIAPHSSWSSALRSFALATAWLDGAAACALRCALRHAPGQRLRAPLPPRAGGAFCWARWIAWRGRPLPLRALALCAAPRPSPRALSRRATWSLTAFLALERLGIVATRAAAPRGRPLVLALLGAGECEGASAAATVAVFWQCLELLARAGVRNVVLLCVGRESKYAATEQPRVFDLDFADSAAARAFVDAPGAPAWAEEERGESDEAAAPFAVGGDTGGGDTGGGAPSPLFGAPPGAEDARALRVTVQHVYGFLHDIAASEATATHPPLAGASDSGEGLDAALLYHGGVWGYSSWRATLAPLGRAGIPIVVTSYNRYEAEDDYDALSSWGLRHVWEEEANPARSLAALRRPSVPERMAWNWYWQCVV